MKIKLTRPANHDLEEIFAYIGVDNINAAERTLTRVFEAIEYLPTHPNMGKAGRVKETKELVISGTPFIVIYQIKLNCILVLRILHASRKWP